MDMEREALLTLFDRWGDTVYRIALSYLRSPQEAEDVVQTVFLRLLEGRAAAQEGKERALLAKITVNCCKDILRKRKRYAATPLEELTLVAPEEDQDLFRAVLELPEKYRAVVSLHYFGGYTLAETAQILRIGPSAASMRLSRAKKLLKEQMGGD